MSSYSISSSSSCQELLVRFARTNAMDDTSMRARGSTPRPRTRTVIPSCCVRWSRLASSPSSVCQYSPMVSPVGR